MANINNINNESNTIAQSLFEFVNDYVQSDRYIQQEKKNEELRINNFQQIHNIQIQNNHSDWNIPNAQDQQPQPQPFNNTELYKTETIDEKALSIFVDALGKQLNLEQHQVFNWKRYFHTQGAMTEEQMLVCFEFPCFIIQYSLILIQVHQSLLTNTALNIKNNNKSFYFQQIINNQLTRTRLLSLIENQWQLLLPNRGAQWINLKKIGANLNSQAELFNWFARITLHAIKSDTDVLANHQSKLYPIISDNDQNQQQPQPRSDGEDWLCLVAQACLIQYDEAFKPIHANINIEDINELFIGPLILSANTVKSYIIERYQIPKSKQVQLMQTILKNKFARVLLAKIISNYYAENQVKSLAGQLNVDITTIRATETQNMYHVLSSLF